MKLYLILFLQVIDFLLIESRSEEEELANESEDENEENTTINGDISNGEPETLLVLTEEEIIAIDLKDENWRMMNLPYLVSLHASAVTCSQYVSGNYFLHTKKCTGTDSLKAGLTVQNGTYGHVNYATLKSSTILQIVIKVSHLTDMYFFYIFQECQKSYGNT